MGMGQYGYFVELDPKKTWLSLKSFKAALCEIF